MRRFSLRGRAHRNFRKPRKALPAIALSEPGHITCIGNDLGYEWVFARGVEAFGRPGDIFIGLTTSGNSPNIVKAIETAERLGLTTIAFLGKGGGKLKGQADLELLIEGFSTSDRIQEAHMAAMHIIIEMVETCSDCPFFNTKTRPMSPFQPDKPFLYAAKLRIYIKQVIENKRRDSSPLF